MFEPLPEWLRRELPAPANWPPWPVRGVRREVAEGHELVAYVRAHLEPVGEGAYARPGLRSGGVQPTFVDETTFLLDRLAASAELIQKAQPGYPITRARVVMRELRACLGWLARRDGQIATSLKAWAEHHANRRAADLHQMALRGLVTIARHHAESIAAAPGAAPALLEEAIELGEWSDNGAKRRHTDRLREARGLLAVLRARTRDVVEIADFVFRHHPDLARAARPRRLLDARAAAGRSRRRKRSGNG
jgi:hypothetical protein